MKFWVEVENVGCVEDIVSLAKELGYDADELALLTDSQDVAVARHYFGKPGKRVGIDEFGGFFVVARDGDYGAIWGFHGSVAYDDKWLYRIHWKLIDEKEQAAIKRVISGRCRHCDGLAIEHSAQRDANGRTFNVWCDKKVVVTK